MRCYYEAGCVSSPSEEETAAATLEGCNAGGTAACRFCGFGSYEPCPVVVTQELVLSGTIDDFDAAEFAAAFAAYLDLPPTAQVRLTVTPASISVSAFILFPDEAQMQSSGVLEKLEVLETNGAAEASVELGVVIESIPSPAVASTAAQSNKLDSSAGLSSEGGMSSAGLAIAGVGAIVLVGVAMLALRLRSRGKGPRRARSMPMSSGDLLGTSMAAFRGPKKQQQQHASPSRRTSTRPQRQSQQSSLDEEAQWEWPSASLKWRDSLGSGAFGTVSVVEGMGLRLAGKRMDLNARADYHETVKMMRREALALRRVGIHEHVTQIFGVVLDSPKYVALLMELADYGSLRDAMRTSPTLFTQRPNVQHRVALHIAEGMAYLHSLEPPMLHHDLKSANVLLFASAEEDEEDSPSSSRLDGNNVGRVVAKLCDFGLASGVGATSPGETVLQTTQAGSRLGGGFRGGTLAYMAPEGFDGEYDTSSEVYAYAIVLWELMTCGNPWEVNERTGKPHTTSSLMKAVCIDKVRPPLPKEHSDSLLGGLAKRCWHSVPASRPRFEQVCERLRLGIKQARRVSVDEDAASQPPPALPPAPLPSPMMMMQQQQQQQQHDVSPSSLREASPPAAAATATGGSAAGEDGGNERKLEHTLGRVVLPHDARSHKAQPNVLKSFGPRGKQKRRPPPTTADEAAAARAPPPSQAREKEKEVEMLSVPQTMTHLDPPGSARAATSARGEATIDAVVAPPPPPPPPATSTNEAKLALTLARGALPFDPARSHRADDNALKSFGPRKHRELAAAATPAPTSAANEQPSPSSAGEQGNRQPAADVDTLDIYTTTTKMPTKIDAEDEGGDDAPDVDIFATFIPSKAGAHVAGPVGDADDGAFANEEEDDGTGIAQVATPRAVAALTPEEEEALAPTEYTV